MGRHVTKPGNPPTASVGFTDVLRIRDFAIVFGAEMQSIVGDQLARVALSVLVYDATHSTLATAATYVATELPVIPGGFLLGRLGDMFSRRLMMVLTDLLRALCFGAMVVPGVPIDAIVALVAASAFIEPVFSSSEIGYLAARLNPEQYRVATGLRMSGRQVSAVVGFALGGVLIVVIGSRGILVVEGLSFLLSAALVGLATSRRSTAAGDPSTPATRAADTRFAGLWGTLRLRILLFYCAAVAFFVVPEGIVVPFTKALHGSDGAVGALLASIAAGGAIGAILIVRVVPPDRRLGVARWSAVVCGVPLVVSGLWPERWSALVCWFVSGLLAAYVVEMLTLVVQGVPDGLRAKSMGIIGAVLTGSQGLGLLAFGAIGSSLTAPTTLALAGACGIVCTIALRAVDLPNAASASVLPTAAGLT